MDVFDTSSHDMTVVIFSPFTDDPKFIIGWWQAHILVKYLFELIQAV